MVVSIVRRGLRRIVETGHSDMDFKHGNHNEKSLRVISRVAARACVPLARVVCTCVACSRVSLSFSELCEISSERETLLTSAEAHRTDRNPSIGLESSSRYIGSNRENRGTRGDGPRVPGRTSAKRPHVTLEFTVIKYRYRD